MKKFLMMTSILLPVLAQAADPCSTLKTSLNGTYNATMTWNNGANEPLVIEFFHSNGTTVISETQQGTTAKAPAAFIPTSFHGQMTCTIQAGNQSWTATVVDPVGGRYVFAALLDGDIPFDLMLVRAAN
jgi:hypothetical protein